VEQKLILRIQSNSVNEFRSSNFRKDGRRQLLYTDLRHPIFF